MAPLRFPSGLHFVRFIPTLPGYLPADTLLPAVPAIRRPSLFNRGRRGAYMI